MGRVTLQKIAEHVGVSKFAVSRSLSGKDGVSEATRKTVERAAHELGYVAPSLITSAKTIQLVLHDHDPVNSEVQLRIQRGIQREADRFGYPVQMQWTHDTRRILEIGRSGAGMILIGPHAVIAQQADDQRRTPMVKVGMIAPLEPIDQVDPAANEATAALGLKLLDYGHRSIVFLQGRGGYRGRIERYRALRHAVIDADLGVDLHELFFNEDGGFLAAFEELRRKGVAPTALVAGNDWIAVSVISDLLRVGLKVPDDISVVGYGDYAAATQTTPQLTTIRVLGEEMGAAALHMLLERIERRHDPNRGYRRLTICARIVERQSLRRI